MPVTEDGKQRRSPGRGALWLGISALVFLLLLVLVPFVHPVIVPVGSGVVLADTATTTEAQLSPTAHYAKFGDGWILYVSVWDRAYTVQYIHDTANHVEPTE
jgi:hypothetical protein